MKTQINLVSTQGTAPTLRQHTNSGQFINVLHSSDKPRVSLASSAMLVAVTVLMLTGAVYASTLGKVQMNNSFVNSVGLLDLYNKNEIQPDFNVIAIYKEDKSGVVAGISDTNIFMPRGPEHENINVANMTSGSGEVLAYNDFSLESSANEIVEAQVTAEELSGPTPVEVGSRPQPNSPNEITEDFVDRLVMYNIQQSIAQGWFGSVPSRSGNSTYVDRSRTIYNYNTGIGTNVPDATAGSILFAELGNRNEVVMAQDNENFYYNNANNRLGLGTNTPDGTLSVTQSENGISTISARRFTDTSPTGDFITYKTADGLTDLFRVDNGGNITASGFVNNGALTVTATSQPQLRVQYDGSNEWTSSTTSAGVTTFAFNGSAPQAIFRPQSNSTTAFQFQNAGSTPILNIDTTNARVGIGTTSPSAKFQVDGTLRVVGTQSALTINNDVTSGVVRFYADGNQEINLGNLSGSGTFRIKDGGDVGVGTSTPGAFASYIFPGRSLHVKSNDPSNQIGALIAEGAQGNLFLVDSDASSGNKIWQIQSSSGGLFFTKLSDTGGYSGDAMNIDATGNVGIGVVGSYKLDVAGNINVASGFGYLINGANINTQGTLSNVAYLDQANTFSLNNTFSTSVTTPLVTSAAALALTPAAGSNLNISLSGTGDFAVNTNQLYVDTSAAFVGIGTSTPKALLHVGAGNDTPSLNSTMTVQGTSSTVFTVRDATNDVELHMWADNGAIGYMGTTTNHPLSFRTNNTIRTTLDASGNFGIGDTSPAALLTVGSGDLFQVNSSGAIAAVVGITSTGPISANSTTATQGVFNGYSTISASANPSNGEIRLGGASVGGRLSYEGASSGDFYIDNLFNNNAGDIRFRTKASGTPVDAMIIQGSGNVGIGTTFPQTTLDVRSASQNLTYGTSIGTTRAGMHLAPTASQSGYSNAITFGANGAASLENANAGIYVQSSNIYGTRMYLATTDDFAAGSKPRITIMETGKVGIGTATPQAALDVINYTRILGSANGNIGAPTTGEGLELTYDSTANIGYIFPYDRNGTTYGQLSLDGSVIRLGQVGGGRVIIGSGAVKDWYFSQQVLQVGVAGAVFSSNSVPSLNSSANTYLNAGGGWSRILADKASWYSQYDGEHVFSVTGTGAVDSAISWTTALTIDNAGDVGIGTSTPDNKLDVEGDVASAYIASFFNDGNNANRYGIEIQGGADDGSGTTYYLNALDGDGTQVGYIARSGGTFALTDVSDRRTKTNINNTSMDAMEILTGLRVVDFNRMSDANGSVISGFIAQEVQEIYPQIVTVGENGYLGITKENLIPVLVKGFQDQQSQIVALQNQVNALQGNASGNLSSSMSISTEPLYLSGDSVGQAKILAGETSVRVSFEKPYSYQPIVTATPNGRVGSEYWIADKDSSGFTIYIDEEAGYSVTFDWHSFAGEQAKLTVSNGTTEAIVLQVSHSSESDSESGAVLGDSSEENSAPTNSEPAALAEPEPALEPEPQPQEEVAPETTPESAPQNFNPNDQI